MYFSNSKEYHKQRRQKQKESGLCQKCNSETIAGKVFCENCCQEQKTRYADRKSKGLCRDCGKAKSVENRTRCQRCLDRDVEHKKKLENSGLCKQGCGNIPVEGKKFCEICLLKATAHKHLKSSSRYTELLELMKLQDCKCPYTGIQLSIGVNCELDHRVAKAKGGTNSIDNLQWVSTAVNRMKWDLDEQEFIELCKTIATIRGN